MDGDRLARVNEGQRACLRLVLQHQSSKDIARALGISPHTVDQRIRFAMKSLGVANRVEAARLLAAAEAGTAYQPLIHQSPDIDPPAGAPPVSLPNREARNDSDLSRIAWILLAAAAAMLALAGLFIALSALGQVTR
jgi:DNA-binding CsgD family transcriptional regulator